MVANLNFVLPVTGFRSSSFTTTFPSPLTPRLPPHSICFPLRQRPPQPSHSWTCMRTPETHLVETQDGGSISVHIYDPISNASTEEPEPEPEELRIVLLIHDFMTDKRLFHRLVSESIMTDCLCIAPDLRGFGSSSAPRTDYSRSEDLYTVVKSALTKERMGEEIEEDELIIDVIGSGMGGAVALQLALDKPSLVNSITVLGSGLPGHSWSKDSLLLDITEPRMAGRLLNSVDKHLVNAAVEKDTTDIGKWKRLYIATNPTWSDFLKSDNADDEGDNVAETVIKQLLIMARDYRGFHFFHEDPLVPQPFNGSPLIDHIHEITQPILAMVGDKDTIDFREIAYEIWERAPNRFDAIVRIEEAGHFLPLEKPEAVATHTEKFWKSN